jgi:hypothetical protein
MNRAATARVPSQPFSIRFDLRSAPQTFNQFLPNGSPATITLSGVDGFDANILYIREDLIREYVGERAIVWFAFGERELRPYPPSPPDWLKDVHRRQANAWCEVLTEADLKRSAKSPRTVKQRRRQPAATRTTKKPSDKKVRKHVASTSAKRARRKS